MTEQKIKGITTSEAKRLQEKYGKNQLTPVVKESFLKKILQVITEPMFLLLIAAATIYFILGEPRDGAIMLIFVVGIISIEAIQEWKTDKTLKALKDLSAPHITVLRDGEKQIIQSEDLVPGDIMYIEEGVKIPADGIVLESSTLSVDESSLTGESEGVWKIPEQEDVKESNDYWRRDYCYAGTLVTQGTGIILVDKIGVNTEYGKIGKDIIEAPDTETPLQKQTGNLVKLCAIIAAILFVLVSIATFFSIQNGGLEDRIVESILSGVTLAMAMIPEEFPVILTVFLSMGAWRLAKKNSIVRRLPSVETLGAVSVLCVDKTGTITMNKMTVTDSWALRNDIKELYRSMGMGCKKDAYDPMEKAMLLHCAENGITKEMIFGGNLIKEYAFTDETKMMGNVWESDKGIILAAKGSPESIINICDLNKNDLNEVKNKILAMSKKGLRVIAVAKEVFKNEEDIKETLKECRLEFLGLIGLTDPPRESVKENIELCTKAGVRVVMITGDNGITASAIAKKINMPNSDKIITGDEINKMSDEELREKIKKVSVFSRVIPEHKMRIVKAFKENGEVVAMTGDGVNDAPALKYADIGIAMGKRGSEVSREAADLILLDDNFSTIIDTIRDGRRIYDNIRKAVGYVFTIHIPIAFASLLAPILGVSTANFLFLPLHVVLLELVIDPTCSIVLERQPEETNIMDRPPRNPNEKLLTSELFLKSILQGIAIFAASFGTYAAYLYKYPTNGSLARTMGLSIILLANILLVQVNSSNRDFFLKSIIRLRKDKVMWAVSLGTIIILGLIIYTPINELLKFAPLSLTQVVQVVITASISVLWYEVVKLIKYIKRKQALKG